MISNYNTGQQVAIEIAKRGKKCIIAKIVLASPLDKLVLAMPYKNRRSVGTVSVPPVVLKFARQQSCAFWVVRFDNDGECYSLPLQVVEKTGWLKTSEGEPEFFVPIEKFQRVGWQTWTFVTKTIQLRGDLPPEARQLGFFGEN